MTKIYTLLFILAIFFPISSQAQLSITYPQNRSIFQRDNTNKAFVPISGNFAGCIDRFEGRFIPRTVGQGVATEWTTIQEAPQGGVFSGMLEAVGGWYSLEVRGIRNETVQAISTVERVGVGEVFLVAGQSNATGGDGLPNGPGATDDRVNSVDFQNIVNGVIPTYSASQLPCVEFVHFEAPTKAAPFGNYAWFWAAFGDSIAKNQNVPVLMFNAGWSSTGVLNWKQSIDISATTVSPFGYEFPAGLPFGHLRLAINNYIAQQGCRAVLWFQGESDNYLSRSREDYRNDLREVIQASRDLSGKSKLAWVISRTSRFPVESINRNWQPVIDAQNDVIGLPVPVPGFALPDVFSGPETDVYTGTQYRIDEIHFTGEGLTKMAQVWSNSLTANFFSTESTPYVATPPPSISVTCAGSNTVSLNAPSGWTAYQWVDGSCNTVLNSNQQWVTGPGTYRLKVKDAFNNVVFSPTIVIPELPVLSVNTQSNSPVSAGSNINLTASSETACTYLWSGPQGFSSTLASPTIALAGPENAGQYQVTVTNTYGCQAQSAVNITVVDQIVSAKSGSWESPDTWTCNCIPTAETGVVLNDGHTIMIDGANVSAKSLQFNGGSLQFSNNGNLATNVAN